MIETKPYIVHGQGMREANQDAFLFDIKNSDLRYFIVCDGVGGASYGEVASDMACRLIADYLEKHPVILNSEAEYVNRMTKYIDAAFDLRISDNPALKGMATTLTLLLFYSNKALVVHVGDSRVYHIRKNEILHKTKDHSLVNELVNKGIISEEEAFSYPDRNIILRAIQGASVKPSKADIYITEDIHPDDYFFLCTDGILESVSEHELIQILIEKIPDEKKIMKIEQLCEKMSQDNYTAILVACR